MSKIRGSSILGTIEYVREQHGSEALQSVLRSVPEEVRQALGDGSAVLTTGWYDASTVIELTRAIDRLYGRGDLALAREVGRHVAFQDVNRFFKWLFRLTGPRLVFARAASVWNNYYQDGRYVFEGIQGTHAAIRVEGWTAADPVLCKRVEGWIERAFELTLGSERRPTIREQAHLLSDPKVSPDPYCRFVADWTE